MRLCCHPTRHPTEICTSWRSCRGLAQMMGLPSTQSSLASAGSWECGQLCMLRCCYLQPKVATRCCPVPCQLTMQQQCNSPYQALALSLWTFGLDCCRQLSPDSHMTVTVPHTSPSKFLPCLVVAIMRFQNTHHCPSKQDKVHNLHIPPISWAYIEFCHLLQEQSIAYDPCLLTCSCKQLLHRSLRV